MTDSDLADLALIVEAARAGNADARRCCEVAWAAIDGGLLTQRQLAIALAVSDRTIRSLTSKGRIPVVRVGDSPRYDLPAVKAALGS